MNTTQPAFDDLPVIEALGLRHAWGVLDEDLGTVGTISPADIAAAARLVRDGTTVPLNLPMSELDPPLFGRKPLQHTIYDIDRNTKDDRLDSFYTQSSSQWDGLRHVRCREFGFFGGFTGEITPGGGRLGIEHWAKRGIVGRGVLLDVARYYLSSGREYDAFDGSTIAAVTLREVAEAHGVDLRKGDILCVRTGWVEAYRDLNRQQREAYAKEPRFSGLLADEEMSRFLWNSHVAALCTDNPAVEAAPGDPSVGSLHRRVLPLLGLALAELLDLDRLARLCSEDGRFDFLFVAVPLNLPGGVGSPANAIAIR